jgi:hypothetical protein
MMGREIMKTAADIMTPDHACCALDAALGAVAG